MTERTIIDSPPDYGDPSAEYAALANGAGLVDRSGSGRLRISGVDALDLLNRLSTNKLESLPPGQGAPTVLTSPKGRVVDLLLVGALADYLLCLTSPGRQQAVVDWIDFYTFGEDIHLQDIAPATSQLTLVGPRSVAVLSAAGASMQDPARYTFHEATIAGVPLVIGCTLGSGVDGFELIVQRQQAETVWHALVQAGGAPAGETAWEAFRIANGAPAYGAEFGEHTNPLESRLRGAISFDKGCYTGQEVVARLDTYKKVHRQLMAVRLTGLASPGDVLQSEGQKAGVLTSVAKLPIGGSYAALAMVDAKNAVEGAALGLAGCDVTATLAHPAYALATEPLPSEPRAV